MKVLYIDPWYAKDTNLSYYSSGLTGAMSKYCDLSVACASNVSAETDNKCNYVKVFFRKSNTMKKTALRSIVRGFEYLNAYSKILKLVKKNSFDVVHIEWLVLYRHDLKVLKKIKKYCRLLVLKVHNILPHEYGEKYIDIFKKIYSVPDVLLFHGHNMVRQFDSIFHEHSFKARIQLHGMYKNHNKGYCLEQIDDRFIKKIQSFGRIYLFFGRIGYDKGVERLISVWKKSSISAQSLLIIAGRIGKDIDEKKLKESVNGVNNIMLLTGYLCDNLLNFLIDSSNLVLTPYINGSMSGVVFTAAEFSKAVLATNFGSVDEYVIDGKTGFVCDNNEKSILEKIEMIDSKFSNKNLEAIGQMHSERINKYFDWEVIGKELVERTYTEGLNRSDMKPNNKKF